MLSEHAVILTFRKAHHTIVVSIDQVLLVVRSYPQARTKLYDLEAQFLAHLRRQDDQFYQRLTDHFENQRDKKKILEFLIHDLKETKVMLLEFFDRHGGYGTGTGARNFVKDFLEFKEVILNRIKMEEEYLFPLLENLQEKQL